MSGTLAELRRATRDMLHVTFVEPVRVGRPRPRSWPVGLGTVGSGCAVVFGLLVLVTLGSGWLRQTDRLLQSHTSGQSVPATSVPLLMAAVVLSFALAATAGLHAPWWLRASLLVLTAEGVLFFAVFGLAELWPMVLAVGGLLGLVGFTIVRSFRGYVWWEFVVVTALLAAAMFGPLLIPGASIFGLDTRMTAIEGAMNTLQPLILPAVVVAASAPAQIVVTAAQSTADRPVGPALFRAGLVVTILAFAGTAGYLVATGKATATTLLAAIAVLVAVVAVVTLLVRRAAASAPPRPEAYPPVWADWLYPLAVGMSIVMVALFVLAVAQSASALFGAPQVGAVLAQGWNTIMENQAGIWWRGIVGVVALVLALRFSVRQRLTEAVLLGAFAAVSLLDVVGLIPGLDQLHQGSAEFTGILVAAATSVVAVVLIALRRFGHSQAVGLMTVLLLAVLYPQRAVLSDPISTALQLAPAAMLVFGITWRVFTEAQVTWTGSARYPQSTRILLFLANILLATTGIAWVSLTRGTGTTADLSSWAFIGDSYLGEPLFYAGLLAGTWLTVRPEIGGRIIDGRSTPSTKNVAASRPGDIAD
jgi:hypothetical protein